MCISANREELLTSPETFTGFCLSCLSEDSNRAPQGRRWLHTILMLCYVLRCLGAKCYDYLRHFVPLPCKQTLYDNFQQGLSEWGVALLGLRGVPEICQLFRRRHKLGDNVVNAVLGVDALAMEPVRAEEDGALVGDNHAFVFLVLSLKCEYKPFPVHILTQKSGNAGETVKTRLEELITVLADCGIKVTCIATDGDSGYQELHSEMFGKWWPTFCRAGIEEALNRVKDCEKPVIADFLHLLKNARCRILNNRVSLSPDGADSFSAEELNNVLALGRSLTDRSSNGKMRDSYALELFTLDNFLRLVENGQLHAAFYILPYCLWCEVIRNPYICPQMRRDLIACILDIFAYHLHVILYLDETVVSQQKKAGILQYFCSKNHAKR